MVRVIDRHRSSRPGAAVGDWRVRSCDRRVRPLTRVPAVVCLPCADRRGRYGQHGDPQSGPATDDARFHAWANDEREHDLLPGRTAAWRARGRARRERVGACALGRVWWGRVSADDRVDRLAHAAVASSTARPFISGRPTRCARVGCRNVLRARGAAQVRLCQHPCAAASRAVRRTSCPPAC